jgi:glutamine amidotransferase
MKKKIVIIDYKLGNIFSVNQALLNVGLNVIVSSKKEDILTADALVLPGVGAFNDAMSNLKKLDIIDSLNQVVLEKRKPILGVCLGLQLLFSNSEEFGDNLGLNYIPGSVKRFKNKDNKGNKVRVPHISWNTIEEHEKRSWENTPLNNIHPSTDMYFVHSFYVVPNDDSVSLSKTYYGGISYTSSILKENIFACQFHPEKSAKEGLKIYKNWSEINRLY